MSDFELTSSSGGMAMPGAASSEESGSQSTSGLTLTVHQTSPPAGRLPPAGGGSAAADYGPVRDSSAPVIPFRQGSPVPRGPPAVISSPRPGSSVRKPSYEHLPKITTQLVEEPHETRGDEMIELDMDRLVDEASGREKRPS